MLEAYKCLNVCLAALLYQEAKKKKKVNSGHRPRMGVYLKKWRNLQKRWQDNDWFGRKKKKMLNGFMAC